MAQAELRLKFRTGGLEADLFPSARTLASWIDAALDRETPFKCTAGCIARVRHRDPETGFEHHGFLNVLTATRLAFDGCATDEVAAILDDQDDVALVTLAIDTDLSGRAALVHLVRLVLVEEPLETLVATGLLEDL